MMRFIMPFIFIGIAVTVLLAFANPFYNDINGLRAEADSYNEALNNSKALETARDELTQKENSIDKENLVKLEKFLPSSVDNIRLILEIEQIALPYGMILKDVKYSTTSDTETKASTSNPGMQGGIAAASGPKDYGVWDLEFSTTGSYSNFLNFTRDLESNLRIVDISSISFSSDTGIGSSSPSAQSYKYDFKIKTYWLKN
jgi:Tfp pilus assembly protein PilO